MTTAAHANTSQASQTNPAHDFDFLIGHWHIDNRRRTPYLGGDDIWETFPATQHVQALPAQIGNFDEFIADTWRPGFVGMSLRIYNPETARWSIYWLTNRNGGLDNDTGALTPPVVGSFHHGIGIFEGSDTYNGQPIIARYTWSHITAHSAQWEQAFSLDNGQSWETNWIMKMTRVPG